MVYREGAVVRQQQKRLLSLAISVACLLIFFTLALQMAISKTPTADEGMHLLRGTVLWQTGQYDLQGGHLPLSHWIIGLFLTTEPTIPEVTDLPSWPLKKPVELVQEYLWQSGAAVSRVVILGRLPVIFVGLLLGATLSWWARRNNGLLGQALVMFLFAFSPNLLGLTSLATTDLISAALFVIALLASGTYFQQPKGWRWLLATITLGLALSTKLSAIIILPSLFILAYLNKNKAPWWKPAALWFSLLPGAGLVLWIVYGFEVAQVSGLPFALPAATYLNSILALTQHFDVGHSAYLLGERSTEGWYHYFVIAYLVKTPAITLILLLVAVIIVIWQRRWRQTAMLWLPALVLFIAASYSRLNIGYRHILAIVPLTWLLIAESAAFWQQKPKTRPLLIAGLIIYALLALRQQPDQLAYFNEFVGGSDHGQRYLGDSNIDWGQDLHLLADYAAELEEGPLFISYFGASDPAYYGLNQPPINDQVGNPIDFAPANPRPGHYAISVNHIQGATGSEPDLFNWFDKQTPVENLGYSILIYKVPSDLDGEWLAHCFDPLPLLDEDRTEQLVGREDLRHLYFDCRSSWVIPTGEGPGWYLLPADIDPTTLDSGIGDHLSLVYANVDGSQSPAYQVYHWSGADDILNQLQNSHGSATLADGRPAELPLPISNLVQLEGGLFNAPVWGSIWQSIAPSAAPISVMLHLYDGSEMPQVADGLGYQPLQWLPGDIFIQFHDYGVGSGEYLETGLYDYTTGDKYAFETRGDANFTVKLYPATTQ